jgi:hypothetical protein
MSEISPRPWHVRLSDGVILDANDDVVVMSYDYDVDAEYIVKAVNAYDTLVAENERLTLKLEWLESMKYHQELEARAEKAEAENERLRKDLDTVNALVTALDARAEKAEAEVERLRNIVADAVEIIRDDTNPCECNDCIDVRDRQLKFLDKHWG